MDKKLKQIFIKFYKNKIALITSIIIILYALSGAFLVPFVLEQIIPKKLTQQLNKNVYLTNLKINPFALTFEAREFQINEPSGEKIIGFEKLYINFQLSSIFRWALTFEDIILDGLTVNLVINPDGTLNIPSSPTKSQPPDKTQKELLRVILNHIKLNQGKINLTDAREPIPAKISFDPLNIDITNLSTIKGEKGVCSLMAKSTDGSTLEWNGELSINPLISAGKIKFSKIPLTSPWQFARSLINIAPPQGKFNIATDLAFDFSQSIPVFTLSDLNAQVMDLGLKIKGAEKNFFNLSKIDIKIKNTDIIKQKINGIDLSIDKGNLNIINDTESIIQKLINQKQQTSEPKIAKSHTKQTPWDLSFSKVSLKNFAINYKDLSQKPELFFSTNNIGLDLKADISAGSSETQIKVNDIGLDLQKIAIGHLNKLTPDLQINNVTVKDGSFDLNKKSALVSNIIIAGGIVDIIKNRDNTINLANLFFKKNQDINPVEKESNSDKEDPWNFLIEKFSVSDFKTKLTDMSVNDKQSLIDLEKIMLTLSDFDGKSSSTFEIDIQIVQGGKLTASGKFNPAEVTLNSDIIIDDINLPILQPYISQIANITLNSGFFSTQGKLDLNKDRNITYQGNAQISKLEIIENKTKDILIGWQTLDAPGLDLNQNSFEIKSINLSELEGKLLIAENRTVNVVEAFKTQNSEKKSDNKKANHKKLDTKQKTSKELFPVKIGKIRLEKGKLNFSDLSLRPQFATNIHELNGVIIGISSLPDARAQVELNGRVDKYGMSKITGEINTFDPKRFTDIAMEFQNIEMINLTPYSGKFAGRKIDSGKISLDLDYHVEKSNLVGNNKIVINTLKLGEKVKSPEALNLPLDLAIALLQDSQGIIDIGLPVSGNLDSPEFKYTHIIWKSLVNFLNKIITSPFQALGSLFGDGKTVINEISFEPGKNDVLPPEQEKLSKLAQALNKRPNLQLTVTGRYNINIDKKAISQLQIRKALMESSKIQSLIPGKEPDPVDFSNIDTQQKLSDMLINQYGQKAYDSLLEQMQLATESLQKTSDSKKLSEDPGKLSKILFDDLVKRESVDVEVLKDLADKRAKAIAQELTTTSGILIERINIKPSQIIDSKKTISAALGLDVMKKIK